MYEYLESHSWNEQHEHSKKMGKEPHKSTINYPKPEPHKLSRKEEFYSNVAKKPQKPDPATVEAILQEEEKLWES